MLRLSPSVGKFKYSFPIQGTQGHPFIDTNYVHIPDKILYNQMYAIQ